MIQDYNVVYAAEMAQQEEANKFLEDFEFEAATSETPSEFLEIIGSEEIEKTEEQSTASEGMSSEAASLSENTSTSEEASQSDNVSVSEEANQSDSESVSEEASQSDSVSVSEEANQSDSESVSEEANQSDSESVSEETSQSDSASVSEETSQSDSTLASDTENGSETEEDSVFDSTAEEETSDMDSASESVEASESDSMSASGSVSEEKSTSASASESTSVSGSASASESVSASTSVSVSHSTSTSESDSAVMSESAAASEAIAMFVNRSAAMLMASVDLSDATEEEKAELNRLLQEYKDNLTALEKAKATEGADVAAAEAAVAKSIVEYEMASKGVIGTTPVWDSKTESYMVTYTDKVSGKPVTEFYKYNCDDAGAVRVYKSNASYVSKDENGNISSSINYEIRVDESGQQWINVDGKDERVLYALDNDGVISYVINEVKADGSAFVSERTVIIVSADKSSVRYVTQKFETPNELWNNGGGKTDTATYKVNGQGYAVAGGNGNGRFVVVQDENGNWHKLILDNELFWLQNDAQLVIDKDNGTFKVYNR